MLELRRLRLLYELSRSGTIAAAAEALSYSPSSVSVQLAQLEREAGVQLLRRAGRNVELTPAGVRLAAYAAEALAADEQIRSELGAAGDTPRGRLRTAAELYLSVNGIEAPARFDVAEVYTDAAGKPRRIEYLEDAFR